MTATARRRILRRGFGCAAIALAATAILAQAQTPPQSGAPAPPAPPAQNPICARLEGQLIAFDRGGGDTSRIDQLKKLEDALNKQQADIDRLNAQSSRMGCGTGFFLFGGQPEGCGPLSAQIQQMRSNLDRIQSDMERLKLAGLDREGQRRSLVVALAQNNCGPQYRAMVESTQPRGFFEKLFGGIPPLFGNNETVTTPQGDTTSPPPGANVAGGYRTLCVRTCDGYYFPISFSTTQARFQEDERACQRQCPAAEVALYAHRNPGEDVNQAVSLSGRPYTELPNAFLYRKEVVAACSCRQPGESWAHALKNVDNRTTIETGDILVDDKRARQMSMPKVDAQGRAIKPDLRGARIDPKASPAVATTEPTTTATTHEGSEQPDPNRKVRSVGTPFLPGQ
ncbi:MAG TPA: DUF2865 domain-containing protein [Xanthobacteraceae bacterium]|nr:DUF2865 domain-containing protein [Xanthobacteraceae bacterium]